MAVTYSASLKNTRMTAVLNAIDADVGAGTLEIGTTGFVSTLVTFTLTDPAGTVSGDTLTIDCDPDISVSASNSGTAAEARIKDNSGDIVISGLTVGTSGTDLIISPSTTITSGQTVNLVSLSIQHA